MRPLLFLLALAGVALLILGNLVDSAWLCLLGKPLPIIALLLWLRQATNGPYRNWIATGLLFSLLGDLLLEWPTDLFVFGLGAFLLAHLAYLVAYLASSRRLAPGALLLALAASGGMFGVLASAGLGGLLLPVACYSLAIGCMLWRALARINEPALERRSAWLAALGAVLFVLSDSLIGVNRFVLPFEGAGFAIMLSYWLGQWGIAASAMPASPLPASTQLGVTAASPASLR
ncbi:MAG TPA: lysoplasmalogenase [Pseudomonas sp.]|nr:lysoplasmalogenase [Pseudomonas sp.]